MNRIVGIAAWFLLGVFVVAGVGHAAIITHYSFDNTLADVAMAGANADDLSALDLTGASVTPVYATGVFGDAASIGLASEGRPSVLRAADSDDLDLATSAWTMEMYVRPDSLLGSGWDRLCLKWWDGVHGNVQYHWDLRGASNVQQILINGGNELLGSETVLPEVWSHLAITNDPTDGMKVWQNGVVVATGSYQVVGAGADPVEFGNLVADPNPGCQFSGLIDDFMIHNEAMDATYMEGRAAAVPEPSAVVFLLGAVGVILWRASARGRRGSR